MEPKQELRPSSERSESVTQDRPVGSVRIPGDRMHEFGLKVTMICQVRLTPAKRANIVRSQSSGCSSMIEQSRSPSVSLGRNKLAALDRPNPPKHPIALDEALATTNSSLSLSLKKSGSVHAISDYMMAQGRKSRQRTKLKLGSHDIVPGTIKS